MRLFRTSAALIAAQVAFSQPCLAFGSIVVGNDEKGNPHYGYSVNSSSYDESLQSAIDKCAPGAEQKICWPMTVFRNRCAAIIGTKFAIPHGWFAEQGSSEADARSNVLKLCDANNAVGGCRILWSGCDGSPQVLAAYEWAADAAKPRMQDSVFLLISGMLLASAVVIITLLKKRSISPSTPAPPDHSAENHSSQGPNSPTEISHATTNTISLNPATPPLSHAALAHGLALKLKRSESTTSFGKPLFILDARMEVSPEIQQHIEKYRLGNAVVYESAARQKHRDAAMGHVAGSRDDTSVFAPPKEQMKGVGKTMWKLARAGVSAARASLALRITVSSLIAGVHVECKSMAEIGEAEEAIVEAARNLKAHLQSASTFTGQEELIEI